MKDIHLLSEETKKAISIAQSIAKEFQNDKFSGAHMLNALLNEEVGLKPLLKELNQDIGYLSEWSEVWLENYPKCSYFVDDPSADDAMLKVFEDADIVRIKLSKDVIEPECILISLCKPNLAFTKEQLKSFPLQQNTIVDHLISQTTIIESIQPQSGDDSKEGRSGSKASKAKALFRFCVDKTSLAKEDKIDPIIGRDAETRMVVEILGRRTKPNVLIVGEPGVGKTALIDGLCLNIVNGMVPGNLKNAILFELDLGSLAAGASYKGEMEERLKSILKEVKTFEKAIIFIDEIHNLFANSGTIGPGVINLLKPELARGAITVIGATTNDEYRKYIEPEEAFNRRFETLRVEEPDEEAAYRMLNHIVPFYKKHHNIDISDDALRQSVYLAQRYLKERRLPDSAIDLIDRTMASIRMMEEVSIEEIGKLKTELEEKYASKEEVNLDDLLWFEGEIKNKISPILTSQLENIKPENDSAEAHIKYLKELLDQLETFANNKKGIVDQQEIAAMVAAKTGIKLGKLQTQEKEKLLRIEEHLKSRVIGQDHAIHSLSEAILESRAGLTKPGQPIGSFFFMGPTGTGKTELAKSLADFLFNDESALVRFDMSEFKEEHSAALLYGAPPGYVGYQEGGLLVNKIRQKPYSVLLFDEIEKAHASVFDLFLQIMDEGKLHDRLGKEGDFSNAIILFTSNIGSDYIFQQFQEGNLPTSNQMMDIMSNHFRPEFLARITEIVPFAPIAEDNVPEIFKIHLKKLTSMLGEKGIELNIDDPALRNLALSGFTAKYGARQLNGVIRNELRRPISKMIINEEVKEGDVIEISLNEEEELIWNTEQQNTNLN